jgi:hypothetical protein
VDPLATVQQLANRLQRASLDEAQTAAAEQDLVDASGLVRAIAHQTISFVADDTVYLTGGDRRLKLPQRPVVIDAEHPLTVVEIGLYGAQDFLMVEHRDYEVINAEELERAYPWYWASTRLMGWPYNRNRGVWAPKVRVTYSHGWTTIPDDIVAIVLDVAQVLMANPKGLRSKTVGGYSETYALETLGRTMVEDIKAKLGVTGRRRGAFSIRQT